jgi:hypothetical protein
MALKAIVENIEDVPEAVRDYYKQSGDSYVLDVDDSIREHPQTKELKNALDGEREKRKKLVEERDKLKKIADNVPEDFDPEEYERLKANGEGGEDVQKKVEEARERERKRWEKKLNDLQAERDDLASKYKGTRTQTELKDALNQVNVAPHLRRAAERLWSYEVQLDDDGNIVTQDGTPLPDAVKEWAETDEGKYFVAAPANGGGGAPGGRANGQAKDNPFSKEGWNLTRQMELSRQDPEKAKRLKAEAGA